jgi:cell division protein FtsB
MLTLDNDFFSWCLINLSRGCGWHWRRWFCRIGNAGHYKQKAQQTEHHACKCRRSGFAGGMPFDTIAPMKWLAAALLVVMVLLQYRIWLSEDGFRELRRLESEVATQRGENDQLTERNRQLAAEVHDLKNGMQALEERARSELGMIASNETFYQVVPPRRVAPAEHPTRTAAR